MKMSRRARFCPGLKFRRDEGREGIFCRMRELNFTNRSQNATLCKFQENDGLTTEDRRYSNSEQIGFEHYWIAGPRRKQTGKGSAPRDEIRIGCGVHFFLGLWQITCLISTHNWRLYKPYEN